MESCGGEVRTAVCPDGADDVARVYIKGKKIPGLAMTRAIGDKTALRFLGVVKTDFVKFLIVSLAGSKATRAPKEAQVVASSRRRMW